MTFNYETKAVKAPFEGGEISIFYGWSWNKNPWIWNVHLTGRAGAGQGKSLTIEDAKKEAEEWLETHNDACQK